MISWDAPPFLVPVTGLPEHGARYDFAFVGAHAEALAQDLGLEAVALATGVGDLARRPDGLYELKGEGVAAFTRLCVITLEPFETQATLSWARLYSESPVAGSETEIIVHVEDEDVVPLPDRGIDVGDVFREELALLLDPNPKKPGVEWEQVATEVGLEAAPKREAPFAALGALKEKLKNGGGEPG